MPEELISRPDQPFGDADFEQFLEELQREISQDRIKPTTKEKSRLNKAMQKLLLLKPDPKDESDQNYFKRANKFCAASGDVQQVIGRFSEGALTSEVKQEVREYLLKMNIRIADKKLNAIPINDEEVKIMKELLKIGILVLVNPKDISARANKFCQDIKSRMEAIGMDV